MTKGIDVLIVDDEKTICELLSDELTEHGCNCTKVFNGTSALHEIDSEEYDVIFLDIRLPGLTGMDLLKEIHDRHYTSCVIMITAVNDVNSAISAMKLGAVDYITKPFKLTDVLLSMGEALQNKLSYRNLSEIDAIAQGVEVRQELIDCHSSIVTKATADIARQLDIPRPEIEAWVRTRERNRQAKKEVINEGIKRLVKGLCNANLTSLLTVHKYDGLTEELRN